MAVALRPIAADASTATPLARMAADVRKGLLARPPHLPSKYFYDDTGSALAELISSQPEYYIAAAEEKLLARVAGEVVERAAPTALVELGSGAGRRISLVLDAMRAAGRPLSLTFFDINKAFVSGSLGRLSWRNKDLDVHGVVGDFTRDLAVLGRVTGRLALLFAGTIGTLRPDEVPWFLERVSGCLGPGDCFLVGVDLVKDPRMIEAAYNDANGVTAAFNLNILEHINRELNADFDTSRFEHVAHWDPRHKWVEMKLRATTPSRVQLTDCWLDLRFAAGDEICTQINCKYTRASFTQLVQWTPFDLEQWYVDPDGLYAMALLRRMR